MTKRAMQTTIILAASAGALALLGFRLVRLAKTRKAVDPVLAKEARRRADEFSRAERVRRRSLSRLHMPPTMRRGGQG